MPMQMWPQGGYYNQTIPYPPAMWVGNQQGGLPGWMQNQVIPSQPYVSMNPYPMFEGQISNNVRQQNPAFNPDTQNTHPGGSVTVNPNMHRVVNPPMQNAQNNVNSQHVLGSTVNKRPPPGFPKIPPPGLNMGFPSRRDSTLPSVSDSSSVSDWSSTMGDTPRSNTPTRSRPNYPHWPKFAGNGRWSTFMMQWEAVAQLQKIGEEEKVPTLIACIKGKAADYMCDLPPFIKSDFNKLVGEMELIFETVKNEGEHLWINREKLDKSYQGNLSVSEFAFRVSSLANRSRYPEEMECPDIQITDIRAGEAFLRGVNNSEIALRTMAVLGIKYPKGIPLSEAMVTYNRMLATHHVFLSRKSFANCDINVETRACDNTEASESNTKVPDFPIVDKYDKPKVKRFAKFQGRRLKKRIAEFAEGLHKISECELDEGHASPMSKKRSTSQVSYDETICPTNRLLDMSQEVTDLKKEIEILSQLIGDYAQSQLKNHGVSEDTCSGSSGTDDMFIRYPWVADIGRPPDYR